MPSSQSFHPPGRRGSDLDVDCETSQGPLVVTAKGAKDAARITLPGSVEESSLSCKFDVHSRNLRVELTLLHTATTEAHRKDEEASSATLKEKGFDEYYSKWDQMEIEAEEPDEEALEDLALQERIQYLQEAEMAQKELRAHVVDIETNGAEAALEKDIERLGLAQDMEDWTKVEHQHNPAGKADPTEEASEDGKKEEKIEENKKEVKQIAAMVPMVTISPQSIVKAVVPKKKVFDYSKWDSLELSDDDEPQSASEAPDRQQLQALATDFSSFRQSRQEREKEREEYWKKRSVFNKKY